MPQHDTDTNFTPFQFKNVLQWGKCMLNFLREITQPPTPPPALPCKLYTHICKISCFFKFNTLIAVMSTLPHKTTVFHKLCMFWNITGTIAYTRICTKFHILLWNSGIPQLHIYSRTSKTLEKFEKLKNWWYLPHMIWNLQFG